MFIRNAWVFVRRTAAAFSIVALGAGIFGSVAHARADNLDRERSFTIPAQSLATALVQFSKQAQVQLVTSSAELGSRETPGVSGQLSIRRALEALLDRTGLAYSLVGENTIAISPIAIRGGNGQGEGSAPQLAPVPSGGLGAALGAGAFIAQASPAATTGARQAENSNLEAERAPVSALGEVIVTAQKREERLIDVPQSVSVLSADDLARLGAVQFRDFANTVPGLSFTTDGAGYTQITLRGVTTGFDIGPTVGIYVDEVPYGSSTNFAASAQRTLDMSLFDVERIEVLRGPQGTLYGASTMGGLIKYVTKRPDTERFGIDLQASVEGIQDGGTDYNGAATVNAPIVADKAALRASTFYSRGGGYIDNSALNEKDVNQSSIYGARADLLLTPADALTVRIAGIVQNISRDGEATADYTFSGAMPYGSLGQNRQYAEPFDQRFRLFSGTINYDFGSVELTSITSYQTARSGGLWDASAVYVPLFELFGLHYSAIGGLHNSRTNKFAQEIRLAAAGNRPLEWVIGGFYTKEQSRYAEEFVLRDLDGEPTPNFLYSYLTPSRYEEHAAFGDLTWNLTDDFDVSGGIRYARNRQKYVQLASSAFTTPQAERNASESVATYLVNARYRFGDHATGYLRYATGYRPGGPNFPTTDPDGNPLGPDSFEADRLKSYEIGLKSESRDRRFGIDVAAYNIDWNNMQISVIRGGFGIIENAPGGARVRGAELVLSARPTRGLDLAGAFAFQDAELSEADPDLGAANGERLPNVPRVTAALNADYELPLGSWQPTVGATLRYVDDRTSSFDNNASRPQYHLPEYTTFDLRAGFTLGAVDAQMYVHNLFNEHGQLSSMLSVFGARIGILQPRTIGLAVTKQFR